MSALYGLVVCGGQSSRMGMDKSLLNYYGTPQRYQLYDMLGGVCEKVFLSCNEMQAGSIPDDYNVIVDAPPYRDIGPMGGVLSALELHPDGSFLVAGCDYPFLKERDMQQLADAFKIGEKSVSFYSEHNGGYEPLLAVYHSGVRMEMEERFRRGKTSLRHLLAEVDAVKVAPESADVIVSVDTLAAYEQTVKQIKGQKISNDY